MFEYNDHIRNIAEQFHEEKIAKDLASSQASHNAELLEIEHAKQKEANWQAVVEICGKFAVWANNNHIPQNSPSVFAPGWLLGSRESRPHRSGSYGGEPWEQSSTSSLLVKSSGSIRELVVKNIYKTRPHNLFASKSYPEKYSIDSVLQSIARMSFEHNVPWR